MSKPVETIAVDSATGDVADLLDRADDHPLVLERGGLRYTLSREGVGAYYDPERARQAMRSAGVITGVDPEELIARIYRDSTP